MSAQHVSVVGSEARYTQPWPLNPTFAWKGQEVGLQQQSHPLPQNEPRRRLGLAFNISLLEVQTPRSHF